MKPMEHKLAQKRAALLQELSRFSLLVQGSYLERFSVCSRKNCACHKGRRHGPRSYVVVYEKGKQRQVYVTRSQQDVIREGIRQHERLERLVKAITHINLRLMREGVLASSTPRSRKGKTRHE